MKNFSILMENFKIFSASDVDKMVRKSEEWLAVTLK